jgi:hypothetical protein
MKAEQKWMLSLDGNRWFESIVDYEGEDIVELADNFKWAAIETFCNTYADEYGFSDGEVITVYLIAPDLSGSEVEIRLQRTWNVFPVG